MWLADEVATHGVASGGFVLVAFLFAVAVGAVVVAGDSETMGPAIAVVGVTVLVGTVAVTELLFEIGDFSEGIGELLADGGIGGDKCTE